MSTTALDPTASNAQAADSYDYRAIHTGSLLGLLVAIVSLVFPVAVFSFADLGNAAMLGVVAAAGLVISLMSLRTIRANPDLYTGAAPALAGVLVAGGSLLFGSVYGAYTHATEVPDGYTRTSFLDLKPDKFEEAGREVIPGDIRELLGEKVFLKGFIRPDSTNSGLTRGISEFLLVRDNNQCCFGDLSQVKFYDQVAVTLEPGLTTNFSRGVFRLGGELSFRPGNVARGEPPLVYLLDADYCQ